MYENVIGGPDRVYETYQYWKDTFGDLSALSRASWDIISEETIQGSKVWEDFREKNTEGDKRPTMAPRLHEIWRS